MTLGSDGGAFRPGRPGIRKLLGDLEAAIMETIWERDCAITVREVHEILSASRELAYTTVLTVMGHLTRKKLLVVNKAGKAHVYRAAKTREQFADAAVARIVDELMRDFSAPAIAHFSRAIYDQGEP